jgi:hypothetical protein
MIVHAQIDGLIVVATTPGGCVSGSNPTSVKERCLGASAVALGERHNQFGCLKALYNHLGGQRMNQ